MGRISKNLQVSLLETPPTTLIDILKTDMGPSTEVRFVKEGLLQKAIFAK